MIMRMQLMYGRLLILIILGEYHDLYVKLDTALLADVFENFKNNSIEIDELDPTYFLTTPGLSWWACLKKNRY